MLSPLDTTIHIDPDTNNPDGRLKNSVFVGQTKTEAGSKTDVDYLMDLTSLALRLVSENSDSPDSVPETQLTGQIYDALVNFVLNLIDGPRGLGSVTLTVESDGIKLSTGDRFIKIGSRGITFSPDVGDNPSTFRTKVLLDVSTASWSVHSSNIAYQSGDVFEIVDAEWSSLVLNQPRTCSVTWLRTPSGDPPYIVTAPAMVRIRESSGGNFEIYAITVFTDASPSGGTNHRLEININGNSLV